MADREVDAVHVLEVGLETAPDVELWRLARLENRIVVSKDEDFFDLANRPGDCGSLLWVRIGNCRTSALLARFTSAWEGIEQSFAAGHRIVILP